MAVALLERPRFSSDRPVDRTAYRKPFIVRCDFDGVVGGVREAVLREIAGGRGLRLRVEDLPHFRIEKCIPGVTEPEVKEKLKEICRTLERVRVVEGCRERIRQLRGHGSEVHITSANMDIGVETLRAWLEGNGIDYDGITIVGSGLEKARLEGDVLVDDHHRNVREFSETGRRALLFGRHGYNLEYIASLNGDGNVVHVSDWTEAYTELRRLF